MNFTYMAVPKVVCQAGGITQLGTLMGGLGARRVLTVSDPGVVACGFAAQAAATALIEEIERLLHSSGLETRLSQLGVTEADIPAMAQEVTTGISRTPGSVERAPPRFAEHNHDVLLEAGYSEKNIVEFISDGDFINHEL